MLDYVCQWLEGGQTMLELTDAISEELQLPIARTAILYYLRSIFGTEADRRIAVARRQSGHGLVEDAKGILDTTAVGATREELQAAKQRADVRLWMAERYNREELGGQKVPQVTINLGVLHLDAMRHRAIEAAAHPVPAPVTSSVLPSGQMSDNGTHAELATGGPSAIAGAIAPDYEIVSDDSATS